jgi:hypothetical protein
MKREPTPEQLAALQRFAERHGRYWKSKLNYAWSTGRYDWEARRTDDAALLQQVRNALGPSWLHVFDIEAA